MVYLLLACVGEPVPPEYTSTTGPEHCGHITADEVWAADLNPHVVTCHVDIDNGTVTLGPGTEVRVQAIKHISVNGATAGLVAMGTEADPVRIIGDTETVGTWNGLGFWDGALGELRHVELLHGGYVAFPTVPYISLNVGNAELFVEDLLIAEGLDYGFALTEGGHFSADSSGLVSTSNGHPGYGWADVVGSIVMDGLDLTGNTEDIVVIQGVPIDGEAEWLDPGVPYAIGLSSSVRVDGTEAEPGHLTIGPGVELRIDAGMGLSVGGYGPGSIRIEGTTEAPVRFTSTADDATSYWEGLRLGDDAIDSACTLSNVELSYGGNGYYNYGNIHLENASPTIVNAWIHDSANYGIYCEGEGAPALEGVTYSDNPEGDLSW